MKNDTIVLIPHYNNPEGLARSLASIDPEEQLDVLIVDDGSIHKPNESRLNSCFKANGTVYYIYLESNKGIEHALNTGLEYIVFKKVYTFIARLDCGDYCVGKRFAIQQQFFKNNPQVKLVGSNVMAIDLDGAFLYNIIVPSKGNDITHKMYLNCMFIHPTVMFKTEVLAVTGYYPLHYKSAEDYAFFFKIVKNFETANINEFLVKIEINPAGISITRRKQQVSSRIKVIKDNFYFGFYPVYGLVRSIILYYIPNSLIKYVKTKLVK